MKGRSGFDRRPLAHGERGGARLNFLIVVALIALTAYSAYQYVPVAYTAFRYKDVMQETVNKGAFRQGSPAEWVTTELRSFAREYDIPQDARIEVQTQNRQITARVRWTRAVSLPGYVYQYEFDHTARSSSFLNAE